MSKKTTLGKWHLAKRSGKGHFSFLVCELVQPKHTVETVSLFYHIEERREKSSAENIANVENCYYISNIHLFIFLQEQQQEEEDQASHRSSTSRLSRSPLRGVKKVKIMQCKVTLLDGADYTLDVEVRSGSRNIFML